jgi:tRNA A-37 threonylcarbamoyl transferase component Bud32/WD40 repeat protein
MRNPDGMTPERWQKIEQVFNAALEREPSQREAYLAQACRGDDDLRREVETLLAQEKPAERFLESEAAEVAMKVWAKMQGGDVEPTLVGRKLGSYKVLSLLGAGGMGEVYRARDMRLNRDVAIKVLPPHHFEKSELRERFEREARTIASLNHPHICTLYDIGHQDGTDFLVMEYLEGETLAARIKRGKFSIADTLKYGQQIADALAAAHAKGIVHRDLKPQNIMLSKGGVKVLDFGLAKSAQDATLTASRAVMGTPAYMAPEQMGGKEVDSRTDIYVLGLVLYEMATGKRAPQGEMPPMEHLPPQLAHVIERCLTHEPDRRWQAAADIGLELEWTGKSQPVARPKRAAWPWLTLSAIALGLIGFLSFLWMRSQARPTVAEVVRFEVPPPEEGRFTGPLVFSLSPDGRQIAFHAAGRDGISRIWVRSLDSTVSRPLAGTESVITAPFWSPDSRFLGVEAAEGIRKIDILGGQTQEICGPLEANIFRGGAWMKDGTIIFGTGTTGLFRCSGTGSHPVPLTTLDASREEVFHGRPIPLPDGRHFLYFCYSRNPQFAGVYVGSVDAQPKKQDRTRLLATKYGVAYAPSSSNPLVGQLLFLEGTTLMAQTFDVRRLKLSGEPSVIAEHVGNNNTIFGYFSASENDTLAYRQEASSIRQLTWFDREGRALGSVGGATGPYLNVISLSPDETQAARSEDRAFGLNSDIWLLEFARGVTTRFTFGSADDMYPVWSPDGSRIAFRSGLALNQKLSNGSGGDELLLPSPGKPTSWSPDGRFLLYTSDFMGMTGLSVLPLQGERKPIPLLENNFHQDWGRFSPDGHWIAYQSDESGKNEVYIQQFDSSASTGSLLVGRRLLVSKDGGTLPRWRKDGQELFYQAPDRKVMAVEVTTKPELRVGIPRPLFQLPISDSVWDVSGDGKRFLVPVPVAESWQAPITVILNWRSALK